MKTIKREFRDEAVHLDGQHFEACVFTNCEMVYSGGPPPSLIGCSFIEPSFRFAGSATHTTTFLHQLYFGGFAEVVDTIIDQIRTRSDKPGGGG